MTELKSWCVTRGPGGWVDYSVTHNFKPYDTFFLKRPMYYCNCGKKVTPEDYLEYSKYLTARKKVIYAAYKKNK